MTRRGRTVTALVFLCLLTLAAVEMLVVSRWASGTWSEHVGFALKVLAFYGIGFGFVARSDVLRGFGSLPESMTSAHPLEFLGGNAIAMGMLFSVIGVGLDSRRVRGQSMALGCLGRVMVLLLIPATLAYVIVHMLVIVPLAYFGYLIASAIVASVSGAAGDQGWSVQTSEGEQKTTAKAIVESNPVSVKSFLVGVPAAALSLAMEVVKRFAG